MSIEFILQLICALFWSITYILIIKKSIKDKTYGMPFLALSLNLAWEFNFTFIHKTSLFHQIICGIWLLLDIVILFIFLRYGYKDFKSKYSLSKPSFYLMVLFSLITCLVFMYLAPLDFLPLYNNDLMQSAFFIANFQNLVMSILFLLMFLERRSLAGQSVFIAFFKWIGTLSVAILKIGSFMPTNTTELYIILLIQVFDIVYLCSLLKYKYISKN